MVVVALSFLTQPTTFMNTNAGAVHGGDTSSPSSAVMLPQPPAQSREREVKNAANPLAENPTNP